MTFSIAVAALAARFPLHRRCDARWIQCSKQLGPNAKVSSLAHLAREAKHELLGISGSDVAWRGETLHVT